MLKTLLGLIFGGMTFLLLLPGLVEADGCGRQVTISRSYTPSYSYGSYYTPTYYAPSYEYKKEVVIATPVAVYLPVPVLAAMYPGYTTPASEKSAPAPAAAPSEMKAVLEALQGLGKRMDSMEARINTRPAPAPDPVPAPPVAAPPPVPAPVAAPPPVKTSSLPGKAPAVFLTKCAVCHQQGKDPPKGFETSFKLVAADGSALKLPAVKLVKMIETTYKGSMPPEKYEAVKVLTDSEITEIVAWVATQKTS